ncbi:hypothetical protein Pelo_17238 [Pelomyxa schiedti]|nr:hypothetical protein Pelo_17238 [Pelomyxa schiedti]
MRRSCFHVILEVTDRRLFSSPSEAEAVRSLPAKYTNVVIASNAVSSRLVETDFNNVVSFLCAKMYSSMSSTTQAVRQALVDVRNESRQDGSKQCGDVTATADRTISGLGECDLGLRDVSSETAYKATLNKVPAVVYIVVFQYILDINICTPYLPNHRTSGDSMQ